MIEDIKVPPLGESVSEATVARWLKKVGDTIHADEPLVELETDKITLEVNAPKTGILQTIVALQGSKVDVGALLGSIALGDQATPTPPPSEPEIESDVMLESPLNHDEKLAPSVAKLVAENQLNPKNLEGTGKDGRLLKGDVLNHLSTESSKAPMPSIALEIPSLPKTVQLSQERIPMTRLRQRIAVRLKEAQNTAAMLTTFNEIDMSAVMAMRGKYKDIFEKKQGVKLGFMSFFTKACVLALKEIPAVNAEIDGTDIIYKYAYDIGVAVSAPQGLVVPVIRQADQLSFAEIEKALGVLSVKAREGKLSMAELTGGTFTITNGGTFGSLMSTPILNPPQAGILGMHKIQDRPMAINGNIEIRPMMYVALTYDHRIIDGKEAVTFLVRIKECVENPERLLLDI